MCLSRYSYSNPFYTPAQHDEITHIIGNLGIKIVKIFLPTIWVIRMWDALDTSNKVHTFSAFWLWSSVVSVLISVTTDISPTGELLVTPIFRWGEAVLSLLRRSYVLPWPGTMPGAARPKTCGSMTLFTSALNFACTHARLPCITKHKASSLEAAQPITLST